MFLQPQESLLAGSVAEHPPRRLTPTRPGAEMSHCVRNLSGKPKPRRPTATLLQPTDGQPWFTGGGCDVSGGGGGGYDSCGGVGSCGGGCGSGVSLERV